MAKVLVEISARHCHVSDEHLAILFGPNHKLTHKKDLSQPGQFACEERLAVIGPKGQFDAVTILGPTRKATQVELTLTEARKIGLTPPIRESGDIANSAGCTLVGPHGSVTIKEGVIIAKRHIHATPADAEAIGFKDKQIVSVKIKTNDRTTVYGDVVIRVNPNFKLAMHIDTDESNAAGLFKEDFGEIIL
jgi:putative phosphotransacetylase